MTAPAEVHGTDSKPLLVSIVLPVYRQADHIAGIVESYETVLDGAGRPHETILVVNGPRGATLDACHALAAARPSVRVVYSPQRGWGRAVKLGIAEARGDLICYTNSARTSPRDLVLLVMYASVFPDVVVKANRKIREGIIRRLGSLIYNLQCRMLFDLSSWDVNGTPKVFPRSFDRLLSLSRDDDLIDAEFNVICRRAGYPMVEVPIFSSRRHSGRSTTRFSSAFRMYVNAFVLWRQIGDRKDLVARPRVE